MSFPFSTLYTVGLTVLLLFLYLLRINQRLLGVPEEVRKLSSPPWTREELVKTYDELAKRPVEFTEKLPPRLDRRYIVTGGNGLVGGYIVLLLLARGTPPRNIRIIDVRKPERTDLLTGPASEIDFVQTDIRSKASVDAAFSRPWPFNVNQLPLTVFHTAAVILASDRAKHLYEFPYDVNVTGTQNVLNAAKAAGATVFCSTSSASISIRPMKPWASPFAKEPAGYFQILDASDFNHPLRRDDEYFGTYPLSKATAERLVCEANSDDFRTGCIRPANGVYGNPSDNQIGAVMSRGVQPTWISHMVQSFVHGANVALAHPNQEAVLLSADHVNDIPQAGRPFVVTDPNPPIRFSDVYLAISTLCVHPFRIIILQPVEMLIIAHCVEAYGILLHRSPLLAKFLPPIKGDLRHLQPALFPICTHLIATDEGARKPVSQGGLGYTGIHTTKQGMVAEILEWNREHAGSEHEAVVKEKKQYTTSMSLADQLTQVVDVGGAAAVAAP